MKIKGAKSINRLIRELKGTKKKRPGTPESVGDEVSTLIQLQREAMQSALEESAVKPVGAFKGLRAAEKLQEEYGVAKTGIRSRFGKFGKAMGMSENEVKVLDQLFGKKVPEEELTKLREKFKIKTPEQVKKEQEQAKAEKLERTQKKQQQLDKIEELSNKIFDLATAVQKTIQGIANKVGAEDVKDIKITKGRYFDPSGKQLKKSEVEKGSGVTYSRKTKRFKDVKTGKFVSETIARQRMNIAAKGATAVKAASSVMAAAGKTIAAQATPMGEGATAEFRGSGLERRGLASKVLEKEEAAPVDDTGKKIDQLSKKVDKQSKGIADILDMFSLKKFYGLIGGAIGAAIPLLKKAIEWVWGFAKSGWQWVKDVASSIGDWLKETLLKIEFTIPGVEAFGKTLWNPIRVQPFSFLKSKEETVKSAEPIQETAPPPTEGGEAQTATPTGTAGGGVPGSVPAAAAPMTPATPPSEGGATRQGTSMPGAAASSGPPRRLGEAAAARGKVDASAAKNAALAAADKYGITGAHKAQFMAQLDHESAGFTRIEENLRYSAKRLRQIFPKYYKTDEEAQADEYQPQKIANRVYGGRMGNNQPEDGYKYRGRGLIQLTGKDNYSRFGKIVGIDLVSNPDAAGSLGTAADIAAAFYKKNVVDKGIVGTDTAKVTKAINGGSIGLSHREQLYASYSKDPAALQATGPAPSATSEQGPMLAAAEVPNIQATSGGPPPATETPSPATATGGGAMLASAAPVTPAAAVAPAAATATPVTPTPASGYAVAADSTAVTAAKEQMVAAAPAPSFVPVPVGGAPSPTPMQPSGSAVKASSRASEDSFVRALAKDFAHPSAFTTIGTV